MKKIIILTIMMIMLVACTPQSIDPANTGAINTEPTNTEPVTLKPLPIDNTAMNSVIEANNKFAIDLFNELGDENIFFSPYSISNAFAMVYEGSKGETRQEIQETFYFPVNIKEGYNSLIQNINKEKDYELYTVNKLWPDKTFTMLDSYINNLKNYYGTDVEALNYKDPTANKIINSYIEEKTKNKIKDLIPDGLLNKDTALVLTNAIYFKAFWAKKFKESQTRKATFYGEEETEVDMMFQSDDFNYYQEEGMQALELKYNDDTSMLLFLGNYDLADWKEYKSKMSETEVQVYIPKFKMEEKYFMKEIFEKMGLENSFTTNADFSGIDGEGQIKISEVIHQSFIEVDEEGTEAAAATAIIMDKFSASMPTIFKADKPFSFIIQEKGNILFMGKLAQP